MLLTVLSPRGAITVTAVTFLASAALLRFGTRARPARSGDGGGTLLKESLAGARLILGDRRVRALMLLFWVPPMFVVAPEALAAPYADAIGVPSAALGLLLCSMAVGHIGAELFVGSALSPRNRSRIVLPVAAVGLLRSSCTRSAPGCRSPSRPSRWPARAPRTSSGSTSGSSTPCPRNCAAGP